MTSICYKHSFYQNYLVCKIYIGENSNNCHTDTSLLSIGTQFMYTCSYICYMVAHRKFEFNFFLALNQLFFKSM